MLPFERRRPLDIARNGISTPTMSTKISGAATPVVTSEPYSL
jgi:hypothetical protein